MSGEQEERDMQGIRNKAAFGMDVEKFMGSPIGQYLQRRANETLESADLALRTVNPEDASAVRTLQNRAAVAELFLTWMGEAITEGEMAVQAFLSADNAEG